MYFSSTLSMAEPQFNPDVIGAQFPSKLGKDLLENGLN
jgi:hypothetical protein